MGGTWTKGQETGSGEPERSFLIRFTNAPVTCRNEKAGNEFCVRGGNFQKTNFCGPYFSFLCLFIVYSDYSSNIRENGKIF